MSSTIATQHPTNRDRPSAIETAIAATVVLATTLAVHLSPVSAATFTDVTSAAGIDTIQWQGGLNLDDGEAPFMTGGAAAGDYDGDGWVDLFVTRFGAADLLYRNRGDGTFENVSAAAGFFEPTYTNGAAWADIDNDGDLDLYLTTVNTKTVDTRQFYLYVNDGQGRFREQAVARNAHVPTMGPRRGFSIAVGDYDRDGYLDLHTTDWGARFSTDDGETPNVARLLKNRGAEAPGYFVDQTESAGVSLAGLAATGRSGPTHGVFAFASRLVDMDGDGWQDLVVAGDFDTSRLFWNNRDGTFTDGTDQSNVGTDENGMGSAVGDYDGDGDLDWFVTSIYDENDSCADTRCNWGGSGNRLYRNEGGRTFSDQTDAAGVRNGGWGWGASFFDYDNDRDLDLVMTNGMVLPTTDLEQAYNNDPIRLWQNDGTTEPRFTDVANEAGIADTASGKGLLTLDYDNDGDLDLFVVNNAGQPLLYRNDLDGTASWLMVDLVGTLSNRNGIGATIFVDPDLTVTGDELVRVIDGGSNFLGQSAFTAHFGLGELDAPIDQVEIRWPSGNVQQLYDVAANQRLTVREVPESATMILLVTAVLISPLPRRP